MTIIIYYLHSLLNSTESQFYNNAAFDWMPSYPINMINMSEKSNTNILIIDDNEAIQQATKRLLEMEGFFVTTASNGEDGYKMALLNIPELILLDIMLPDMSGLEVLTKIKTNPDLKNAYVILVSGFKTGHTDIEMGMALGADDFIPRTVSTRDLIFRISTYSKMRKSQAALSIAEKELQKTSCRLDGVSKLLHKSNSDMDALKIAFCESEGLMSKGAAILQGGRIMYANNVLKEAGIEILFESHDQEKQKSVTALQNHIPFLSTMDVFFRNGEKKTMDVILIPLSGNENEFMIIFPERFDSFLIPHHPKRTSI